MAQELGAAAPVFLNEISEAFLSGLAASCIVVACVAIGGSLFASGSCRPEPPPAPTA